MERLVLITLSLILLPLSIIFRKKLFFLLVLSIFTTEFLWINIGGGIFRISHFLAILVLLVFSLTETKKVIFYITRSRILIYLLILIFYNIFLILFNVSNYEASFFSLGLMGIMFTFSLDTYLFLSIYKGEKDFFRALKFSSLVAVLFGLAQYIVLVLFNKALAFTEVQRRNILFDRRITSFFTEGDTFGKNVMLVTLLFLPFVYPSKDKSHSKKIEWSPQVMALYVFVLIINATRSALAGFMFGLLILMLLSIRKKTQQIKLYRISRDLVLLLFISIAAMYFLGHLSLISRRFSSLFSVRQTLSTDASAKLRFKSITEPLKKFLHSGYENIIFGSGWANLKTEWGESRLEGTSNIFATIFIYDGILGFGIFLAIIFLAFKILYRNYLLNRDLALGTIASLTGALVASQMAPMLIAPEFWVLLGLTAYLEQIPFYKDEKNKR